MNQNIQFNKLSLNLATSLIAVILIVFILWITQTVVIPLFFSIIISVMVYPICRLMERMGLPRMLSTTLGLVIATLLFVGIGYLIVTQVIEIAKDATMIIDKLEILYKETLRWVSRTFHISQSELLDNLLAELKERLSIISKYIMTFFQSFSGILASGVLVPIYAFFFIYYRDFFKTFFLKAFKSTPAHKVEDTLEKMYDALQNYMIGQVTVMVIVAILNTIGLYFIGVDHAWFFGILASLLMILPYIGITIGSIFPAIFALATLDSPWYAIAVIGWYLFVQFLEGNFITPNIVGGKVSLNPLVSMIAIIIGGLFFGFAGFILALPFAALLKVICDAIPQLEAFGYLLGDPDTENKKQENQLEVILAEAVDLTEENPGEME